MQDECVFRRSDAREVRRAIALYDKTKVLHQKSTGSVIDRQIDFCT